TVINSGTISGTGGTNGLGIVATNATVINSGTISGTGTSEGFGIGATNATVTNSGTISGAGGAGRLDIHAQAATGGNSGTISGNIGIQTLNPNSGSTITNSGTIIGTGGTAIQLTSAADTLTLLAGSRIVGVVDMGLGNDTVNVVVAAPNTKVSSLTTV